MFHIIICRIERHYYIGKERVDAIKKEFLLYVNGGVNLSNKVIYINVTLKLRRIFDIIFYISILLYGNMLILYYGKLNISLIPKIAIIL